MITFTIPVRSCVLPVLSLLASGVLFAQKIPPHPEDSLVYRNLSYVTNGHARQKLDLYIPKRDKGGRPPLIVWVHGGGWFQGSKENCQALGLGFVERGFAIASINYRYSQDAVFPAQLEDCKAAIRWLRAHASEYGYDASRVGVWGSSAGGHLVALLGTTADVAKFDVGENPNQSSRPQAVVDYYGPTDFLQAEAHDNNEKVRRLHAAPDSPPSRLIGGDIHDPANAALVAAANPITYISDEDPPFLIVHGDIDPRVPHHQSELLHAALAAAGVPTHLVTVRGGVHGSGGFPGPLLAPLIADFFDRYLRGDQAAARWPKVLASMIDAMPESTKGSPPAKTK